MTKRSIVQSLFLLLAKATDKRLAQYVEFLKAENRMLRERLPKRILVTDGERSRLLRLGRPLGRAVRELITIVSPRTFLRWANGGTQITVPRRRPGRPRTSEDIRALVLQLAEATAWGSTRILGELKKLGLGTVSRSTVVNILRNAGFDPGPKRGEGTWADFLQRHAATLWACDFFTTPIFSLRGRVTVFVLFFIHVATRRVIVSGVSRHPDRNWMAEQARLMNLIFAEQPVPATILLRDHDGKFTAEFDDILQSEGVRVQPVGPRAPNMNAVAERFVQTVKRECLEHFAVAGESHLKYLLNEYLIHYHVERPHQGRGNCPPFGDSAAGCRWSDNDRVYCHQRLGGLIKHYSRAA